MKQLVGKKSLTANLVVTCTTNRIDGNTQILELCSRPDGQPQVDKQGFKSLQLEATSISVVKKSSD